MARISEKNPRYRSKDTISQDLAEILASELSYGTKFAVVSEITWVWSEFDGKFQGCKYWSEEAIRSNLPNKDLRHEHLVPKKVLIDRLFALSAPTAQAIHQLLSLFCIGVVVTKDEDDKLNKAKLRSTMPDDWDHQDPWARYRQVGIAVQAQTA